ncbi:hypothetical protein [Selenomonas sp. AE3005]|uniref:hypothetical protein n=1 Tax=Selenomonas sp. AE3005 TaxID=1485543 RepID=UPI0025EF771D|nr:hypothetical protein [Selenomonas sp. AE3005]
MSKQKKYYLIGGVIFLAYILWLYSPAGTTKNPYTSAAATSITQTESKSGKHDAKPTPVTAESVSVNKPFSKESVAEVNIKGTEFVEKVIPTNPRSVYSSYTAEEGKVYFVLNATLKNLKKAHEDIDKLVRADVYYDDGYKYHCMLIIDRYGDLNSSFEYIDPLQLENVKFAVQLPKEAQTDTKPIKVVFEIGTQKFEYVCR